MRKISILLVAPLLTFTIFSACNKPEGCTDPAALNYDPDAEVDKGCEYAPDAYAVQMHMHQFINGGALVEGSNYTINGTVTTMDLAQFYVSGITLVDAQGVEHTAEDVYLLVRPEEEAYSIGNFPPGDYTKVIFNIGVDSITNHADPSVYAIGDPLGAQSPSMHWGWSFGYIFMRIDGEVDSDGDSAPDPAGYFEMHVGDDHYLATIELDYNFTIGESNENIVHLEADWDTFFSGVDMVNDNTFHGTDNVPLANLVFDNIFNMFSVEEE